MRSAQTILGLVTSACLTVAPVYANPHGRPATSPPHAQAPKTPGAPTLTGKPSSTSGPKTTTPNPIALKISSHPQLASKVKSLLPSDMTLNQASNGFKNQGQFIAALHASKDLNIPFAQLKAEMTGKDHDSLGAAIQELKPAANARTAAKIAENEADTDVKTTAPPPTSRTGDRDRDDQ